MRRVETDANCNWRKVALPSTRISARLLLIALFGFILTWVSPGIASAHTELVSSDPAAGAELTSFPGALTLEFSGPLLPTDAVLSAYDSGGGQLVLGAPVVEGSVVRVAITPPDYGGSFVLSYRVISEDGHPAKGQVAFSVTTGAPQPVGGADAIGPVGSTDPAQQPSSVTTVGAGPADATEQAPEKDDGSSGSRVDEPVAEAAGGSESNPWIWWVGVAVVGALAVAAALVGAARHRRNVQRVDEEARAVTAAQRPELTK